MGALRVRVSDVCIATADAPGAAAAKLRRNGSPKPPHRLSVLLQRFMRPPFLATMPIPNGQRSRHPEAGAEKEIQ